MLSSRDVRCVALAALVLLLTPGAAYAPLSRVVGVGRRPIPLGVETRAPVFRQSRLEGGECRPHVNKPLRATTVPPDATSSSSPAAATLAHILDVPLSLRKGTQLVFVGGKGGVGKTTTSCAIALSLAERGLRTLLVSTDPAHSINDALQEPGFAGSVKIESKPTKIESLTQEFYAMEVDAAKALEKWQSAVNTLTSEKIGERYGTLGAEAAKSLGLDELKALASEPPPGIDELVSLAEVVKYKSQFDVVVVDTAPTGHALRLLDLPKFADSFLDKIFALKKTVAKLASLAGNALGTGAVASDLELATEKLEALRTSVQSLKAALSDEKVSEFVAVALPTTLSVRETERLVEALPVPCRSVVVNRVLQDFSVDQARMLAETQRRCLQRLKDGLLKKDNVDITEIPFVDSAELVGEDALRYFAATAGLITTSESSSDAPNRKKQPKLYVVGGKGGVGKSTVASSLATALADEGHRVCAVSTDPAHSLGDALGVDLSPGKRERVFLNLEALEIDADAAADRARELLKDAVLRQLGDATESAEGLAQLADALETPPPGVDELVALLQVLDLLRDDTLDAVVLDTAPTGHTLRMLSLPETLDDFAERAMAARNKLKANPLVRAALASVRSAITTGDGASSGRQQTRQRRRPWDDDARDDSSKGEEEAEETTADRLRELQDRAFALDAILHDPKRCEFLVVAAPTDLSVAETLRLKSKLDDQGIPNRRVIVNGLLDDQDATLELFADHLRHTQRAALDRLQNFATTHGLRLTVVPQFDSDLVGKYALLAVAEALRLE